uniref:At2g24240-like C-terminal beta-propeller domain-containing protein n=1 Tax=Aegilops tauschii TaxID=37682 RepID=N1QUR4_AEGTA
MAAKDQDAHGGQRLAVVFHGSGRFPGYERCVVVVGNSGNVQWLHQSKMSSTSKCNTSKLAVHGGLLLASKDDTISVYGGPNYDLRLALRGSQGGGAISDFSVGGDRLFAVHQENNVLNVWETPPPPII